MVLAACSAEQGNSSGEEPVGSAAQALSSPAQAFAVGGFMGSTVVPDTNNGAVSGSFIVSTVNRARVPCGRRRILADPRPLGRLHPHAGRSGQRHRLLDGAGGAGPSNTVETSWAQAIAAAPQGCTEATAIDLGAPANAVTVRNNGCLRVRDGYPFWWGRRVGCSSRT
jgi:hypothetical protein